MTSEAYTVGEVDDLGDTPSHCSNCDWKGKASETGNIGSCCLTPGDPSPVGRCPSCDSLVYVDQRSVRIVIGLDGGIIQGVTANVHVLLPGYMLQQNDPILTRCRMLWRCRVIADQAHEAILFVTDVGEFVDWQDSVELNELERVELIWQEQ